MQISQHEQERLLVTYAADVAQRRRSRGLRLNYPEAVAVLTSFVLEGARDGRAVADLMSAGRSVLTYSDVMDGVPHLLESLQVEATFPDGTKLVTLHSPILPALEDTVAPGAVQAVEGTIELAPGRARITVEVSNTGDRPIQVGSHYHFAAANPSLSFDRDAARGYRLDIPAGTSVRFEPGISRSVALVALAGARTVPGLRPEYAGDLDG